MWLSVSYPIIFQGTKRSPDPEYVTNQQLRHMCDNVLQLLTNTVEQMENVSARFEQKEIITGACFSLYTHD